MFRIFFLTLLSFFVLELPAQNIDTSMWVPNNLVTQMCMRNDTLYMMGGFSQWGPNRPYAEIVDSTSGIVNAGFPRPNGVVLVTEPDGRGGYFIGGGFTQVGDSLRSKVAHIDANGNVSTWNAGLAAGTGIQALYFDGTNLYVGGQFTIIGGQPRNNIAAIDTFGNVLPWNPNANSIVHEITKLNNKVYAAGYFSTIGGQPRQYLAQIDATTGLATAWNPNPNSYVNGDLKAYGDRVFAAGNFTNIGSAPRANLAALDTISGLALPFNWVPGGGGCTNFIPSGDSLFICGSFTSVNGQPHERLAVIDTSSGALRSWNPSVDGTPYTLLIAGNTLYVGGVFTIADSTRRNNVCAYDMNSGALTSWDPSCGGEIDDFCKTAWGICVAGRFPNINTIDRWELAAYDVNAHAFTPLQMIPGSVPWGQFHSMAVSSNRIYVGGTFNYLNNQIRNGLGAIDISSGNLLPWDPNPIHNSGPDITTLFLKDSVLYACGYFSTIGGQQRHNIACLDTIMGNATTWHPVPNSRVQTFLIHDSLMYIGGNFTLVGAQAHQRVALISLTTGLAKPWNPSVNGQVNNVHIVDTTVIATGFFTTANLQPRAYAAAFGQTSGNLLSFNAGLNGGIDKSVLSDSGSVLYLGGQFTQLNSIPRNKIAAINSITGNLKPWNLEGDYGATDFIIDSNKVWVTGFFSTLHNLPHSRFVGVDVVPDTAIITLIQSPEAPPFVKVFPNPSRDKVVLQLVDGRPNAYQVILCDINGRTIMTQQLHDMETTLDFSGHSPGVYFLRMIAEDGKITGTAKIIIAR